jgi:hypothetical protein
VGLAGTIDTEYYAISKPGIVTVLADTIVVNGASAAPGAQVPIVISGTNLISVGSITIPVQYSGDLAFTFDSISTVGCRTEYFATRRLLHYDPFNKRITILLDECPVDTMSGLPGGSGDLVKIWLTVSPGAVNGQTTSFALNGYGDYLPKFNFGSIEYRFDNIPGTLSAQVCCLGERGNVDNDPTGAVDITDLIYLVEYSFSFGPAPICPAEADVDGSGEVDISDVIYLVEYMFADPPGPSPLQCE